jgi:hypothetical protein
MERHTLRSDDLLTVVDESLKEELRAEKQLGVKMQEQMRGFEEERHRIRDQAYQVDKRREEFASEKVEAAMLNEQRSREVAEI